MSPVHVGDAHAKLLPLRMVDRLLLLTLDLADGPLDAGWQLRRWADAVADLALLTQVRHAVEESVHGAGVLESSCTLLDVELRIVAVGLSNDVGRPGQAKLIDRITTDRPWMSRLARVVIQRRQRPVVVPLRSLSGLGTDEHGWLAAVRHVDGFWLLTLLDIGSGDRRTLPGTPTSVAPRHLRSVLRLMHTHLAGLISVGLPKAELELRPRLALTLDHLLTDKSEADIAEAVHRSPHTVHANVKELYRLYGVSSRPALMAKFIRPEARRTHRPQ